VSGLPVMVSVCMWRRRAAQQGVRRHKNTVDDLTKILVTSSLTVLGAVIIFVSSQLLGKLVIEPIHDLKRLLGEIQFALVFHAQAIMTPVGDRAGEDEAAKSLRKLSCDLRAKVDAIPFYDFWARISRGFVPSRENTIAASKQLMGLSNSVHQPDRWDKNDRRIAAIEKLLGYESLLS
jgi:hypothetical protein